jgi:concanavalin A-like lectin/glucanase superfamily protein
MTKVKILSARKVIAILFLGLSHIVAAIEIVNEYRFDDTLGKTILDIGTSKSHLSMKGFPQGFGITESPFGLGTSFLGDQVLEGTLQLTPGNYENIAVECWVCCKDKNAKQQIFLQIGTAERISLEFKNNRIWCRTLYSDSKVHITISAPVKNQEQWHHVMALRDGNSKELKLYIDGKLAAKKKCPNPVSLTRVWRRTPSWNKAFPSIHIGNGNIYNNHPFKGMVDEVRILIGEVSEKEIASRADRTRMVVNPGEINVALLERTSELLRTLKIGINILQKQYLPSSTGQIGEYLITKWRMLNKKLNKLKNDKTATQSEIRAVYIDLEKLENEIILESINIIYPGSLSTRRPYAWYSRMTDPTKFMKKRKNEFLKEIDEMFRDWQRNARALKKFAIITAPDIEAERIRIRIPQDPALTIDRVFEQAVAFYKKIAQERYRLGAAILSYERELEALQKAAAIRGELGAKLKNIASLENQINASIALWRKDYNQYNFSSAASSEHNVQKAIKAIKEIVYSEQEDIPIVRPGASLKSTGRYAFGGSWQSLPNCEVRGGTFYRGALFNGQAKPFRPYEDNKIEWNVSSDIPDSILEKYEVKDASWTYSHRVYTYRNVNNDKTIQQDCWWTMLAPGTLFDTHGPKLVFSDNTLGNPAPPDKIIGVFGKPRIFKHGEKLDPAKMTESWLLLLWENSAPQVPILIFFEKRPQRIEWQKSGLTAINSPEIGKSVLALAYGAAPKAVNWSKEWTIPPEEVVKHCRKLTRHLAFYPLSIDEFYSVGKDKIRIWNHLSKYIEIKDDWNTPKNAYIPVPFVYALGIEGGAPINFDQKLSDSLMSTKFGFFKTIQGKKLSYTIPRFRMWQREVLKPSGEKNLIAEYNRVLPKDRPAEAARFYEALGHASGWCLMNNATRKWLEHYTNPKELEDAIAGELPLKTLYGAHHPTGIDFMIETTMGKGNWVRGWRGFRHGIRQRGDLAMFNMYTLSGAYAYAKLFGKWDMVEKHWDVMQKGFDGIASRQDWAVPGHDCMTTGWIFSGDMLGDGWRTNSLMASMAKILGHKEDEDQAVYQGSRTMATIGCTLHPNTIAYNAHVKNDPRAQSSKACVAIGGSDSGFYTGPYDIKKSWAAPLYNAGCTIFDYPFYDCLLDYYPETSRMMINNFIKQIPGWELRSGEYRNPVSVSSTIKLVRKQNSWQTLKFLTWTTKDRKRIRDIYEKNFAPGKSKRYSNYYNWSMFGNVLPHIIAQNDPIWLAEWDQAVIESGEYNRKTRCALIKLKAPKAGKLSMVSGLPPTKITVNGKKLEQEQYLYDNKKSELFIPFDLGRHDIQIFLPEYSPEKLNYPDFTGQPLGHPLKLSKAPKPGKLQRKLANGDLKTGICEEIDISRFCNMGFADEVPNDKRGGTHDDGETWIFPKGQTHLRGVLFNIVDPDKNNGKSCIVLKGKVKDFFPKAVANIPVNKTFRRLFFLHGTAYTGKMDGETVMTYILHFDGEKKRVLNIRRGINIGEWKSQKSDSLPDLPSARAGKLFPPGKKGQNGKGVSGYVFEWKNDVKAPGVSNLEANQRGLAKLKSIDIISYNKSVPMVFGISGEKAE